MDNSSSTRASNGSSSPCPSCRCLRLREFERVGAGTIIRLRRRIFSGFSTGASSKSSRSRGSLSGPASRWHNRIKCGPACAAPLNGVQFSCKNSETVIFGAICSTRWLINTSPLRSVTTRFLKKLVVTDLSGDGEDFGAELVMGGISCWGAGLACSCAGEDTTGDEERGACPDARGDSPGKGDSAPASDSRRSAESPDDELRAVAKALTDRGCEGEGTGELTGEAPITSEVSPSSMGGTTDCS